MEKRHQQELTLEEVIGLTFRFLKRRSLIIIVATSFGIALGLYWAYQPRVYSMSITVESMSTSPYVLETLANKAANAINQNQFKALGQLCNCSSDLVSTWTEMSSRIGGNSNFSEEFDRQITLTLSITDTSLIRASEQCLLTYMRNNELVSKRQKQFIELRKEALASIEQEISELNAVQAKYQEIMSEKELPLGIYSNGASKEMLELISDKMDLMEDISYKDAVYPVSLAIVPTKALVGWLRSLATGLLIGFFLGIVLAIIFEIRSIGRKHETKAEE